GRLVVEVEGYEVGVLARGTQFGELALLRDAPRAATARAETDVGLYSLAREDFLAAIAGPDLDGAADAVALAAAPAAVEPATALARVALLEPLGREACAGLAAAGRVEEYDAGAEIVRRGDRDDTY